MRLYDVIHAIYDNWSIRAGSVHSTDKPYIQFFIVTNSGLAGKGQLLVNRDGVDWKPIILALGAGAEDAYPLTLAMDALTTGSYSNSLSHDQLRLSQGAANPPRRVHQNLRSQVRKNRMNPGSNTYFKTTEEKIEYLLRQGDYNIAEAQSEKFKGHMNEVFFIRFFQATTATLGGPERTAYEVSRIVSDALAQMGGVIEGTEDDVFEPASDIIWAYETAAGRMPDMPDQLFESASKVQNKYMGRLAQLRRTLPESLGDLRQLEVVKVFAELWPASLTTIKDREYLESTMINNGAKQDIFRSDQEMKQIDEQTAADEARDQQLALGAEIGKVMPPGKAIEENSPAALALGAA